MIFIQYHPLVSAIVQSWRARLPVGDDGRTMKIGEEELRELIAQLCRAIDVFSEAMDTEALLARLRGQVHDAPSVRHEPQ